MYNFFNWLVSTDIFFSVPVYLIVKTIYFNLKYFLYYFF